MKLIIDFNKIDWKKRAPAGTLARCLQDEFDKELFEILKEVNENNNTQKR